MNNRPGQFFHEFADRFDTIYDGKRNRFMRWVDQRFRSDMFGRYARTFAHLGDLKGRTVLDVGCGSGPYALEALRRGASKVTALDAAPRMLELTDARLSAAGVRDGAKLVEGIFPDAASRLEPKHDYAIVMGVMDYVADADAFVRELARRVTGGAVLSFPSTHWFRTPLRKVRYRLRRCPLYFYDEQKIRRLLTDGGFRHVEVTKLPGAGMDYVAWARP
jgi:2-polyprenyl-3-methyl-5-hydroxy-6-metoxy-1,4-benzoquinol methylase